MLSEFHALDMNMPWLERDDYGTRSKTQVWHPAQLQSSHTISAEWLKDGSHLPLPFSPANKCNIAYVSAEASQSYVPLRHTRRVFFLGTRFFINLLDL